MIRPAGKTWEQLFRYVFVGGAAFIVDFSILYVLTEYGGLDYLLSAALSFTMGLMVNYLLCRLWVFGTSLCRSAALEFGVFAAVGVVGLGLNELLLWLLTDRAGLWYMLSKAVAAVVVLAWNFWARKLTLYR